MGERKQPTPAPSVNCKPAPPSAPPRRHGNDCPEYQPGQRVRLLGQLDVTVVAELRNPAVPDRPDLVRWIQGGHPVYSVAWIDAHGRHATAVVHPLELAPIATLDDEPPPMPVGRREPR